MKDVLGYAGKNVVITGDDCNTTQGITKGVIYRGEKVEVSLADSIRAPASRCFGSTVPRAMGSPGMAPAGPLEAGATRTMPLSSL